MKCLSGLVLLLALAATLPAQMRALTDGEQDDIQQAVKSVNLANPRDSALSMSKSAALPSLRSAGGGRMLDINGVSSYSERKDENHSHVEVATLVRELRLLNDGVAMVDGFFRTLGWPRKDDQFTDLVLRTPLLARQLTTEAHSWWSEVWCGKALARWCIW